MRRPGSVDPRRIWRRVRRVWATLGTLAGVTFFAWSLIAYRAAPEAHAATAGDAEEEVRRGDGTWRSAPGRGAAPGAPALVLFPGALVDAAAYAALAR
ncbi:hypothetical protein PYV61_22750, partial [Roseisolibacter sp. H3M3-2]